MIAYLLLVLLTIIVNAEVVLDTKCEGVIIDGKYHDKEILKTLDRPYLIAVDYSTNIMYLNYNVNETAFKSALFDIDTKELKDINDALNGLTQTVDQNTHDVYIGGYGGIYKYDYKNHKSELYAAKNKDVWRVFFKDVLYFSEYPVGFMNTYKDGNIKIFEDLEGIQMKEFVIDGEDVMFYNNATGFYSQKKGSKDAVLYVYSREFHIKALTVDVYGNAYICTKQAIYKVDKKKISLDKLMDVNDCWGLAFDSYNNMIYSDRHTLFRLKVNKDKTC